ncbi:MAG: SHOCT domain-containing protein [Sphingomicrobium sp.]
MHFEISERLVTSQSAENILRFAERQMKKVSRKADIKNGKLRVQSIEASFGSINRADDTTITIQQVQGGHIILSETHYRPSFLFWVFFILLLFTYVGWIIPLVFYFHQRGTVRDAIQSCIERIKNEFNVNPMIHSAGSGGSYIDDLKKLAELRDAGVVSEDEFQREKANLLGRANLGTE